MTQNKSSYVALQASVTHNLPYVVLALHLMEKLVLLFEKYVIVGVRTVFIF